MSERAPAVGEIEITPEMLDAGASVLCGFETETADERYWAEEVYRAMAARRRLVTALDQYDTDQS